MRVPSLFFAAVAVLAACGESNVSGPDIRWGSVTPPPAALSTIQVNGSTARIWS